MKYLIVALVFTVCSPLYAQVTEEEIAEYRAKLRIPDCHCEDDTLLTLGTACDTVTFSNKAKFIRFFNCDSLWTVFVSPQGKRQVLMSYESLLFGYDYRLGYQVESEFRNAVLFRYGCPANGPCDHVLIDKTTGKELREFGELIYKGNEPKSDLIVFFSNDGDSSVTVFDIEQWKEATVKVRATDFEDITTPEYEFEKPTYNRKANTLHLPYTVQGKAGMIVLRLNKLTWRTVK